jgi:hypothetical protein
LALSAGALRDRAVENNKLHVGSTHGVIAAIL